MKIMDAHIHLDQYTRDDILLFAKETSLLSVISVSTDLASCIKNKALSQEFSFIKAAYGYHPEQTIPSDKELADLFSWITSNKNSMVAIGEVGLPHYIRRDQTNPISLAPYIDLLEQFILLAKKLEKPIILHSIYEETDITIDLLEKHNLLNAHFHWFKGKKKTIERMISNGYRISFTPDLLYKERSDHLAQQYPIDKIMVETDGPWPFDGPFMNHKTVPTMIHDTIHALATRKHYPLLNMYEQLLENTRNFYSI